MHNRDPAPDDAVEKGGLTNIGTTDDGDET
jgi:hypothetical protein